MAMLSKNKKNDVQLFKRDSQELFCEISNRLSSTYGCEKLEKDIIILGASSSKPF